MDYLGAETTTRPTRPRPTPGPSPRPKPQAEPIPAAKPAPLPENKPLELVRYSDKSFAIFGDTKPVKDKLTDLGGKFNRYLKREGIPTPGYIFSIKRIDTVRKALSI